MPPQQIANELLTRTQRVLIVTRADAAAEGAAATVKELVRPDSDADIERVLVAETARMHETWWRDAAC